jgi:hypothetical protein
MPKTSDNNGTNGGLTNEGRNIVQNFHFLFFTSRPELTKISEPAGRGVGQGWERP